VVLLRREIGDVLRHRRTGQGRTLREVSAAARVSLGYLSEVERGQKEPSSELLSSICGALDVPLSALLLEVSTRVADAERETLTVPDTVPPGLADALSVGLREGRPADMPRDVPGDVPTRPRSGDAGSGGVESRDDLVSAPAA
jgi:transcriptional regulator with XRE-family HTH domain